MPPRLDLGPKPYRGYTASRLDRAAERRADADALAALERDPQARAYVVGGELVALKRDGDRNDPPFGLSQARGFGRSSETIFLGLCENAPRFALALDPAAMEALKPRADLLITDLRSIAVRGLVDAEH